MKSVQDPELVKLYTEGHVYCWHEGTQHILYTSRCVTHHCLGDSSLGATVSKRHSTFTQQAEVMGSHRCSARTDALPNRVLPIQAYRKKAQETVAARIADAQDTTAAVPLPRSRYNTTSVRRAPAPMRSRPTAKPAQHRR